MSKFMKKCLQALTFLHIVIKADNKHCILLVNGMIGKPGTAWVGPRPNAENSPKYFKASRKTSQSHSSEKNRTRDSLGLKRLFVLLPEIQKWKLFPCFIARNIKNQSKNPFAKWKLPQNNHTVPKTRYSLLRNWFLFPKNGMLRK